MGSGCLGSRAFRVFRIFVAFRVFRDRVLGCTVFRVFWGLRFCQVNGSRNHVAADKRPKTKVPSDPKNRLLSDPQKRLLSDLLPT